MPKGRVHELRYLVEIPIPYVDRADRDAFLSHRDRLLELVVSMGEDLDQADVFILAYASDSLLIEVTERTH